MEQHIQVGLRWSAMRQVVTGLAGSLGALAYTRMLQPEDLGAFGVAMLVYNGLFLLIEAPIRDAVVYYQDQDDRHSSAAFWILLCASLAAVVLAVGLAGVVARFYNSPIAVGLVRVLALAFLLRALAVVPNALLLKHFRFALHEGMHTAFTLILFAGWVILAALGYGAWSLVIPVLASTLVWVIVVWLVVRFRPVVLLPRKVYGDVLRYSRSLFGSKLITYIKSYIDNAAVGTLGERSLGWYSLGEDQSGFAVIGVGATIANICLPVLARLREQMEEFRRVYLEMLRLAATLSTPMQIGVLVLADLGVYVFFGEQWLGATPVLRAYLVFRLVETLNVIGNAATSAIGRPEVQFYTDLAQLPFFVAATWLGLQVWGGVVGVAWSLAIVRTIVGLVYFVVVMRVAGLRAGSVAAHLLPSSLAGVLMGVAVHVLRIVTGMDHFTGRAEAAFGVNALALLAFVLAGALVYFCLLYLLDRAGFRAVLRLAWQVLLPEKARGRIKRLFVKQLRFGG